MKFSVSQSALAKAITVVSKGLGNSTLDILGGIYINASEGTVEFQTTDLNISIRHRVAANVEEAGAVVISGKVLSNIVKNLPDAAVTFERDGHNVHITCQKSSYLLHSFDASEFPDFPTFDLTSSVELPVDLLNSMVTKLYKVVARDTSRPMLSGIYTTVKDNKILMVATDTYRLAVCDTSAETSSLEGSFESIIPGAIFHDVLSLPTDTGTILLGVTNNQVVFVSGNTTLVTRKLDGNFPDQNKIIPQSCICSVNLSVSDFEDALKRVCVIATAGSNVRIDVDVDAQTMRLSTTDANLGEADETISVEANGESFSSVFNHHYVSDCITAVKDEETVTFEVENHDRPGMFKSYASTNYLYLLMPVRV